MHLALYLAAVIALCNYLGIKGDSWIQDQVFQSISTGKSIIFSRNPSVGVSNVSKTPKAHDILDKKKNVYKLRIEKIPAHKRCKKGIEYDSERYLTEEIHANTDKSHENGRKERNVINSLTQLTNIRGGSILDGHKHSIVSLSMYKGVLQVGLTAISVLSWLIPLISHDTEKHIHILGILIRYPIWR